METPRANEMLAFLTTAVALASHVSGEVDALGRRRQVARLDVLNYLPQMSSYSYRMVRYQSRDVWLESPPKRKLNCEELILLLRGNLKNYSAERHREFILR